MIRNAPVLMGVIKMTCSSVRIPSGVTESISWPGKNCLTGNLVKDTVCRHRCVYGIVELDLLKQHVNIVLCPTKGEKQVQEFHWRP